MAADIAKSKTLDRIVTDGVLRLGRHVIAEALTVASGDKDELLPALEVQRRILAGALEMLDQHMQLLGWEP